MIGGTRCLFLIFGPHIIHEACTNNPAVKPCTHNETFVCNSVLQAKVSWCVRPRNMFQEIFGDS